jgi:6-phosphofructokinase 2
MAAARVLTVTVNPALDVAVSVEYLVPDHKLEALDHRRELGGGGVNVARVLDRLGVESQAWLAVGGAVGDELLALAAGQGLDAIAHRIDGTTRESIAVNDRKTGRQYRIVLPGPSITDHESMLTDIEALAAGVDVVVLSGGLPPGVPEDFYRTLCDALEHPVTVVDAKGAALARTVESSADVVKPSRRELASLVSWIPADLAEVEVAARQVLERGRVGALAVSLGGDGAMLVQRDGPTTRYDAPEVTVASTVGAGDSMVAGLVAGLVAGESLIEATRRGVAAGSATAMTPGTDLCHRPDVEQLLPQVQSSPFLVAQ